MQLVTMKSCWIQAALNPIHVLVRIRTQTERHMKTEAEVGVLLPQATPKMAGFQQEEEEAGRMYPLSLCGEHSPAHTLTPHDGLCNCEGIHVCCLKPRFVVICYMP